MILERANGLVRFRGARDGRPIVEADVIDVTAELSARRGERFEDYCIEKSSLDDSETPRDLRLTVFA